MGTVQVGKSEGRRVGESAGRQAGRRIGSSVGARGSQNIERFVGDAGPEQARRDIQSKMQTYTSRCVNPTTATDARPETGTRFESFL